MWWLTILIVIGAYLALSFVIFLIQEYFLFHPEKLPPDFQFSYNRPFEELYFEVKEGVRINGLHFKTENPRGMVLYFHGNTRSVKGWGKFSLDFTNNGYDVVMVDYRGFGKSTGKRSEYGLKNDAQFVYHELTRKFPEENLILYGRSMGSGFAAKLASNNSPRMLVLECPYYSLFSVANRYLFLFPLSYVMRFKLRTFQWMRYIHVPVYCIHGTKDRLIPFQSSLKLVKDVPAKSEVFLIEGAGHNDLPDFPEYHEALRTILGA
ncbi:MAG: alpha/beta hydrolase [Bacteroidia bacterium]|nr:alpha/beta hydrolase [Bacteroidia bacterium]